MWWNRSAKAKCFFLSGLKTSASEFQSWEFVKNGARRWRLRLQSLRSDGVPVPARTCSRSPASFPAIIEHVRDGSVVRALLLPDYYLVTVMLSGVKVKPHSEGRSEGTAGEGRNK